MVLTHRGPTEGLSQQRDFRVQASGETTLLREKETDYDPRTRPWWKLGEKAQKAVWAEPFLFASRRQPGVVLTLQQLDPQGDLQGVWLMEYELSYLAKFLRKMKDDAQHRGGPFADANVYIVSKKGLVIGHPAGQTVTGQGPESHLMEADGHPDGQLSEAYRAATSLGLEKRQRFAFTSKGQEFFGMSAPFDSQGGPSWTAIVTVPEESLMAPIRRNNQTAGLIAALVTLLSVLFGAALAERFVRPLSRLALDLDRIGRLDFSVRGSQQSSSRIREISDMMSARDRMTAGLRSFSKYVPAGLVRQLMANGQEATLGGETRELTVFFSDIVGFTSIAERITAQELVDLLAVYLGEMSAIIDSEQGTVDKYIGDAVMAFWGAPAEVDNHAIAACRAALRCERRLEELRTEWRRTQQPEFFARIGINSGETLVGNIGSEAHMNYTVMGDPVNVASRLEGLNKRYETTIFIGERTRALAGEVIVARPIDRVAVKGKEQGIVVYELLAMRDEATDADLELERRSEEAFSAYLGADFDGAATLLEALLTDHPDDIPLQKLVEQTRAHAAVPPTGWTGVTDLRS